MQILFKKESEMTKEEKLKLELMRTLCIVDDGVNISDSSKNFDLTKGSKKYQIVDMLLKRFGFDFKNQKEYTNIQPERMTTWPGEIEYEKMMANSENRRKLSVRVIEAENRNKINLLKQISILDSGDNNADGKKPKEEPTKKELNTEKPKSPESNKKQQPKNKPEAKKQTKK